MEPGLMALLTLHVAVMGRDEEATRQALRHIALEMDEREAHRIVQVLQATLDDQGRGWLMRLA